ncbi:NAD(P)-dependent oxidoreductase [Rhodopila sp.]|uniref:NAD(P)-dependent oxidoreductase n=1 Tax=Rhodopila sp. TaxID=2480087 RepID=UPI003D0C871E
MSEMTTTVGFVGVGNMGWPMAACLVNAGFAVNANDSRREIADNFVQQVGGFAPDGLRQLAESSDVIVTMLPNSAIVERVLAAGDDNLLAGMKPGTVIIEMSSGVPSITQRLAEQVAALGSTLIDAPVSGGVPRAKSGQLAIMVGGEDATIDKVIPILSAMGTSVLKTGAVGSGQAMKALNNMVSTGGFLIGIEALLIGQRFGLNSAVMTDVLNAATGMNNSTQKKFKQFVLSRKFDAGFTMGLLAKDLSIAMQIGRETATAAPVSALVNEMIVSALVKFGPEADHTEMAKLSELLAGSELDPD